MAKSTIKLTALLTLKQKKNQPAKHTYKQIKKIEPHQCFNVLHLVFYKVESFFY